MHKTRVQIAREEALEQGIEQGIEKGIERGIERGREQGLETGHLRGLRAAVTELLEARFATVPPELAARLATIADPVELRRILIAAGTTASFADFRASLGG